MLSTTNGILCACATFAMASISATSELGFPNVSIYNAFVLSLIAASNASGSGSTKVVVMPYCGSVCSNRL